MNANELADSLEAASSDMEYNYHVSDWKLLYECALVMRQQQAEIEALKAKYEPKPLTKEQEQVVLDIWKQVQPHLFKEKP